MKKSDRSVPYYPIFLDISGRRCVVVGGGMVALRKVMVLLEHGAAVEVISPRICPELSQLGGDEVIKVAQRKYVPGDLEGAFIAIVATDDGDINRKVAEEAASRRILVNVVDDPRHSDFIVPSYLRRGEFSIAISTGGMSPALARKVRTSLERSFGTEYGTLALLINRIRSELKQRGITVDSHGWDEALDLDLLLPIVRAGRTDEAKGIILDRLKSLAK